MKSSLEMRQEAKALCAGERRSWRIFGSAVQFMLVVALATAAVLILFNWLEIETWDTFQEAQAEARAQGLDLVPPNLMFGVMMTVASLFQMFFRLLVNGLWAVGGAAIALWAAYGRESPARNAMFFGFRYPFGSLWLNFSVSVRIALWACLVLLPCMAMMSSEYGSLGMVVLAVVLGGVVAIAASYRYRQAFFIKVEHPHFRAAECVRFSVSAMRGMKWRLFCYDCSWWKELLMPLLLCAAGEAGIVAGLAAEGAMRIVSLAAGAVFLIAALPFSIRVMIWILVGHAIFYRELKGEISNIVPNNPNGEQHDFVDR